VANRIVFQVAHDIFDNWFEVEEASDKPDPKFNESVQQFNRPLHKIQGIPGKRQMEVNNCEERGGRTTAYNGRLAIRMPLRRKTHVPEDGLKLYVIVADYMFPSEN
jgi:hypothetical protein